MGSTVTSLIYASFTFLLFAIEASIMSVALNLVFDIPMWLAHICSSLVVIPIALYGISLISKMQIVTQPIWLILQFVPIAIIAWKHPAEIAAWTQYGGTDAKSTGGTFNFVMFGLAASVLLSLLPQIGEQVDYLRFLPNRTSAESRRLVDGGHRHRARLGAARRLQTTGRIVPRRVGCCARACTSRRRTSPPSCITSRSARSSSRRPFALVLTGIFVIVCQLKINVTNAYAGSIAWSNFFSRLTHSHPGRVVWLVFNVLLALLLMEIGIFRAIESILVIYANFAAGWIGALTADLVINKPLGFSPKYIEFKRAHLYDINPVGVGALVISVVLSSLAFMGAFGRVRADSLAVRRADGRVHRRAADRLGHRSGKYYLGATRQRSAGKGHRARVQRSARTCSSAATSPCARRTPAPSARCAARSKRAAATSARPTAASTSSSTASSRMLPRRVGALLNTRAGHFGGLLLLSNLAIGLLLGLIYQQYGGSVPAEREDHPHHAVAGVFRAAGGVRRDVAGSSCSRTRAGAPPRRSPRARPPCSWTKSTRTNAPTPRCRKAKEVAESRQRRQDALHRRHQPRDPHAAQFHLRLRAAARARRRRIRPTTPSA
mgnify:CR=1 FL=1